MAVGIADAVIGKLTEKALQKVEQKALLVLNFNKDFQWIRSNLTHLRGYLEDADTESGQEPSVRNWLQDVQDVVFDAEDIVEDCDVEPLYRGRIHFILRKLSFQYKMGQRIRDLKERVKTVKGNAVELALHHRRHLDEALTNTLSDRQEERKKSSLVESNAKPVALEPKVDEILGLLGSPEHKVIAVVGMGGIGKTFLVQNVFQQAKQRFDTAIWLSISPSYSIPKLQLDVASHIKLKKKLKDVSQQQAAMLIHEKLARKRAFIVLDDVWPDNTVLTEELGIPVGASNQIKVIVTTRQTDVCQRMNALRYDMKLLSVDDSWNLFCAHAFSNCPQRKPPQNLENVARDVESKCDRLPLAIKTIATSLADKRDRGEWESMFSQLKEVSNKAVRDSVLSILQLSYNCLPLYLKPCFLYFSFFGEDKKIDVNYLIECWIAEGFIPPGGKEWTTGLDYLFQLRNLCLVEVWEEERLGSMDTYCRIHGLLLRLTIVLGEENKCAFKTSSKDGLRRILLAKKGLNDNDIESSIPHCPPCLRTLSLSGNTIQNIPTALLRSTRFLRVIDFSYTQISTLPECVGNLRLLRVLNLLGTAVYNMPQCVRKLKSLHSLYTPVKRLPVWIGKLKYLRHLSVDKTCHLPKEISKLSFLRILQRLSSDGGEISLSSDDGLKLEDVVKLNRLQRLGVELSDEVEVEHIRNGILAQLTDMLALKIYNYRSRNEGSLPYISDEMIAMKDLKTLTLHMFAPTDCICKFDDLRVLCLSECNWSDYPALQIMCNLRTLRLWTNKSCRKLPQAFGESCGFPWLQSLEISDFPLLEELPELGDGAMKSLEVLGLFNCETLQKIPEGWLRLKNLKRLEYRGLGSEFMERIKEGGEDRAKIKAHNPLLQMVLKEKMD